MGILREIRWYSVMKEHLQKYKKSINEIISNPNLEAMIWDFYVTKSISGSSSQGRAVNEYGLSKLPWKEMKKYCKSR